MGHPQFPFPRICNLQEQADFLFIKKFTIRLLFNNVILADYKSLSSKPADCKSAGTVITEGTIKSEEG